MIVSALVVTLDDEIRLRSEALAALAADERLTLGPVEGVRVPVVAEVPRAADGEQLVSELQARPGILFVDVVLVDFSDAPDDRDAEAA
jgi:hypothetical protein